MDPALKSSLLWGTVSVLTFLVFLQGYHLWRGELVSVRAVAGVAGVIFCTTALSAHLLRPRLAAWNERT